MKIKFKKNFEGIVNINDKSDFFITLIIMLWITFLYVFMSDRTFIITLYFFSLIWYIFFISNVIKLKWLSGLGLYLIYLILYVQCGALMNGFYSYYTNIRSIAITTIMIYNFVAPIATLPLSKICHYNKVELRKLDIQENWLFIVFSIGVASMLIFYIWNGFIPLLSVDAENVRVSAIAGKGFLIVIANNCFLTSMALSQNRKKSYLYLILGGFLIMGTGFRSQLLVLIIVFFLTNYVGRGKKFIFKGFIIVLIILLLYAILGLMRSNIDYDIKKIYLPIIWRFFVNFDNYDIILKRYPVSMLKYGSSFINDILVVLPGSQQTFMMQLKEILNYNFDGGSLTPSVFGEGYYNWGIAGTILWPIFNIYFLSFLDSYNKKKFPGGVYYAVSFGLTSLATSSFIVPLTNSYLPSLVFITLLIRINKKYKIKFRR